MIHLGDVPASTTIYIPFTTYAGSTGASVTCSGLAVTDIEIYKNGSTTQRSSEDGYTLLDTDGIDFDGITGLHGFSINLGDNTDSGFFAVGSWYWVVVSAITVDSQTVTFLAATFRIGPAESLSGHPKVDVGGWLGTAPATPTVNGVPEVDVTHWIGTAAATPTTAGVPEVDVTHWIGTAASQPYIVTGTADSGTTNTLVDAARTEADADFWKGQLLEFTSGNLIGQTRLITGFVPGTDTIAFTPDVTQTVTTQTYRILPFAGADVYRWYGSAVAIPTTAGVPEVDVTYINGSAASGSGTPDVNVSTITAGAITAAAIATGAIDADALAADAVAEIADGVWDEDATGHQTQGTFGQAIGDPVADTNTIFKATVTDATLATVGLDVVNVSGRIPASLTNGNMDSYVAQIGANAVNASALATDAVTEIWAGSTAPTAATIAEAIWDEDATAHQTQGTFGQAIGDPVADTNSLYKAVVTDATGATVGVDVVALKAETVNILADTAEIGTAGAGLTALATAANLAVVDNVVDAIFVLAGTTDFAVSQLPDSSTIANAVVAGMDSNTSLVRCVQRLGFLMAQEIGVCADAGTSAESYTIIIDATTYTIDHVGLDATGNRGTAVLSQT